MSTLYFYHKVFRNTKWNREPKPAPYLSRLKPRSAPLGPHPSPLNGLSAPPLCGNIFFKMTDKSSRRDQIFQAARQDRRRRRREGLVIGVLALLVGGLFYLSLHFTRMAEQSALIQPFIIYFANFGFWALMLVLILVLVFLIVRNVAKFVFERRKGVLGARIRVRLIMAFMALTLGPAAVLFLLSTFILNTSIERLYEPHVRNVVETSQEVINSAASMGEKSQRMIEAKYESDGEDTLHFASQVSRVMLERGWIKQIAGEDEHIKESSREEAEQRVHEFLERKREEYNLAMLAVYDRDGSSLTRSASREIEFPRVPAEDVQKALSGEQGYTPPVSVGQGAVLYAFYPVPLQRGGDSAEIGGAVVCGRLVSWFSPKSWVDASLVDEARAMTQDYQTLSRLEIPMKLSYFVLLVFVTLIVIFLAIWFGFRMSKGITEPIQLLAEGTEMVASGNLDFRIEMPRKGEDEISILVRSFNKMTGDLAESRNELGEAYRSLRETNLELEQRRNYVETVLAHVDAGVVSVDSGLRVSTINPAALRMLGRPHKSEVLGSRLADLLRPEEMEFIHSLVRETEDNDKPNAQRQFTMSRDDKRAVVLITVSRLRGPGSGSTGMVIVIDDVTEMIRAQRAMAWREVARRIAHEIKNPLTPIQLAAQRLQRRYADDLPKEDAEVLTESTRTIIHQVEELKRLVNEFSLFARLPSARPLQEDIHRVIREVLSLYSEAHHGISFRLEEAPELPMLELDRDQMKRAFINLFDNAVASIVACQEDAQWHGEGRVIVRVEYDKKIQVARIEVADNGHGIPGKVKERLFEPYYSTKQDGTGLGLSIVQRIIADHYGYVRVVDNQPAGTRVIVELPVISSDKAETGEAAGSV